MLTTIKMDHQKGTNNCMIYLRGNTELVRLTHTLSFKKPTVRVTSEFLGLAET